MFCSKCGNEMPDNAKVCPHCGAPVEVEEEKAMASDVPVEAKADVEQKPAKVWTVFSIIGKILGIVCFATAFIPYLNYMSLLFAVPGIVFSCLGRKAKTEAADKNFRLGLGFSIAAIVVAIVVLIVIIVAGTAIQLLINR